MKRLALVFAMILALAVPAKATSVTGNLSLAGLNTYNSNSITFTPPAVVLSASGSLSEMLTFPAVTLDSIPNFATADGRILFDWNHATDISLKIDTLTVLDNNSKFLNIVGTATATETGDTPTLYDFSLASTNTGITSFTLDATAVPEPGSLVLLGSGLISLAGLLYRARRTSSE